MKPVLGKIVDNQQIRATDSAGSGRFAASRKRKINGKTVSVPQGHMGIDIVSFASQPVYSPIDGEVVVVGQAYSDDKRFKSLHIQGTGCYQGIQVKLLYVNPIAFPGNNVDRGQQVAVAQDLTRKYKSITNHIHFEVRFNGQIIDPTNKFGPQDCGEEQVDATTNSQQPNNDGQSLTQVIPYIHTSDETTISQLLQTQSFDLVDINVNQFATVEYNGMTNHRRIYNSLNDIQKKKINNGIQQYNPKAPYPITAGCEVFIPISKIQYKSSLQSNITITKSKSNKYFAPILSKLTNDPGYVPAKQNHGSQVKDIRPQLSVWIWSKTLYQQGDGEGFIDISNDVISCDTSSTMDSGGNFTIQLQSVVGALVRSQQDTVRWQKSDSDGETSLGSINAPESFESEGQQSQQSLSTNFYYNKIINQNDLVFISFEKLQLEGEDSSVQQNVSGKWYDMIGMVDINTITATGQSNDIQIHVRGRDLLKVLQEDNSYFNPYSIGHVNSIYGGSLSDRFLQGGFQRLSAILPRSIKQSVEFIFHRIASIGYVPNDVFSSFLNKTEITKTIRGVTESQEKSVKGVWQIIKVFIDQSITRLRVIDDSIANPEGSIVDILNKIAQKPFVEFFGDTYGDKFYLTFRQPPFTYDALSEAIWNSDQVDSAFSRYINTSQTSDNKYNEYEQQQQQARKKSNEKTDIINGESDDVLGGNLDEVFVNGGKVFPKTINIDASDVYSEDLHLSNEGYAWYKLTQRGDFAGNSVNLGHVPALYFDKVAQVFGNRMLDVTSNYSDYYFFNNSDVDNQKDLYAEQASQILAFLVETNIYLPFTRQGRIVINGDRRIKKGNWIYYRPTKEMFYVTTVDNSVNIQNKSIDRTTTLVVERGMKKRFVRSNTSVQFNGKTIRPSYFDIVDVTKLRQGVYDTIAKGSVSDKFDYKSNMALNEDIFEFFLENRQFANT